MKQNAQQENEVNDALAGAVGAAYPAPPETSVALERRVAALALAHEAKRARRQSVRRAARTTFALAAAAGAVVAAAVVGPRVPAAYALGRMSQAMEDARSAYVVMWQVAEDGSRTKSQEAWYQGGRTRTVEGDRVTITRDGKSYGYRPQAGEVFVRPQKQSVNASGFSVGAMVRDYARRGVLGRFTVAGNTTLRGREARLVYLRQNERERLALYADPETDLPFYCRIEVTEDGRAWRAAGEVEMTYDAPVPESLFALDFPPGTRTVNEWEAKAAWRNRLAKGLETRRVADRKVTLRDVQANADGDVFVLFTAGRLPTDSRLLGQRFAGRDWSASVTDDRGTTYLWNDGGHFQPSQVDQTGKVSGFVFDRERLEGAWFSPLEPQTGKPFTPKTLTITFRVAPRNLHGRREDHPERRVKLTERVTFTVPLGEPACEIVPDYIPYMAWGPSQAAEVRGTAAAARAHYYRYDRGPGYDWDRNVNGPPDRPYLEKALRWYREELRIRQSGGPYSGANQLYDISRVLRLLGRTDEAEQALREAKAQDYYGSLKRQIAQDEQQEAWRRERGLGPMNR